MRVMLLPIFVLFIGFYMGCNGTPSSQATGATSGTTQGTSATKNIQTSHNTQATNRLDLGAVKKSAYLQSVIGISEDDLRIAFADFTSSVPAELARRDDKGFFNIINKSDGRTWAGGKFEFDKTVGELINDSQVLPKPNNGTFNVVDGSAFVGQVKEVDVAWLQAQVQNQHAVFQIASNQNALEQNGSNTSVDVQRLDAYPDDKTQGPIASISAAPGLLIRWGYAFFDSQTTSNEWRQTDKHQINFLENFKLELPVNDAGYVLWTKEPTVMPDAQDYQKIKIAYHEGIQVSFGDVQANNQYSFFYDPKQIIDQVFCAAVALGTYQPHVNVAGPVVEAWSKQVLKGMYEGTIRYAALKKRNKVFLTRVGGGAFGNKAEWIDEAIVAMKDFIIASGLEVILVNYIETPSAAIKQLVQETKGCYEKFDNKGNVIERSAHCKSLSDGF